VPKRIGLATDDAKEKTLNLMASMFQKNSLRGFDYNDKVVKLAQGAKIINMEDLYDESGKKVC
jgi:hypothetical protein